MKLKKMLSVLLSAAMLMTALTACGEGKSPADATGRNDLIVGTAVEPSTMDPNERMGATITENMHLSLTSLATDGSIQPGIAKDWKVSDDGLEYVFEIDTGIKFANGDNVTAEDVIFSLNRARAVSTNSQYFECLAAVEPVDDTHVKCVLAYPCALFVSYMSDSAACIVNKKVVEAAGDDYGINPAGSCAGPYDFVSWEPGVCVKLTANPYYSKDLAIKDVEFRFITEASTGAISVEAGDIDVYENANFIDVENLRSNDKISIHEQVLNGFDFIGFNVNNPPYDNALVRQAIAYSIDQDELIDAAIGAGGAKPARGFCADFVFGYSENVKTYERDTAKAKQLLADAGYPNGLEITLITMDGTRNKVAEYLQDAMRESGFTVKIEQTEWSKFVDDLITGNLGAFIIGVAGDIADADGHLYPQFITDGGSNVHGYSNPQVDEMLKAARQSDDSDERLALYEDIQNVLMEELPCIPLYCNMRYAMYNSQLKNYTSNYSGAVLVENMSW